MTSITLDSVTKQYSEIVAASDIDLEIEDGEFVSIVGPSGCGKTTTLRTVAGLEEATEGTLWFGNEDVTQSPAADRNVGMVFQNLALYPHMTARENMAFGLEVAGIPEDERADRIETAAKMLDINGLLDRSPSELSGGQQQRVAIGRTIVLDPDVFLLDEPLASLDAKLRVEIREELQQLQDQIGITTIYVTHDQEQAMTMSDRILVMNEGEVQQFASPQEVYNNPANEFVAHFIGTPSMNFTDCELITTDSGLAADLGPYTVSLDDARASETVSAGKTYRFGVRPEHMELMPDADTGLDAEVKLVEPTGKENIIHLDAGAFDLKVIVPGERDVDPDATQTVTFDPAYINLFNIDTGDRVY